MFGLKTRDQEPEPIDEFERTKRDLAEAMAAHQSLREKIDAMTLALQFTTPGPDGVQNTARVPDHLMRTARPFLNRASRRREKFKDEIAEAQLELDEQKPQLQAATEAMAAARRRKTNEIALEIQPRHRAALEQMAEALETLSRAIVAERECRQELERRAPLPTSPHLPDLSSDLKCGTYGDFDTPAWRFRQKLHDLGILT